MKLVLNGKKCPGTHKCPCVPACPKGAVTQKDKHSLPDIDQELCILCGKCLILCPKGAFEKVE